MSKVGEWLGMLGVQEVDMNNIQYWLACCSDCTKRCKGLSDIPLMIPACKSGPAPAASTLVSKGFVAYLVSFLGVSFYLKKTNLRVSKAIDVLYGKELQRLGPERQ